MRVGKWISALGAFFVLAACLAACGSGVNGDSVASMSGNQISQRAFDHWLYVAAKGNASQSPSSPVIVPSDPPNFQHCIAQVRKQIPSLAKTSDKQLKTDCNQLFTSLSSQVMDFLIRAYWYQAEAAKRHVTVTNQQVQQAFQTDKAQQFPTAAAFGQFLAQSGQTLPDILFRVRINQLLKKLLALHGTTVTPATIQAYYSTHPSQFGTPQTRDLRLIRTNSAAQAAAAKAALSAGQSWSVVAKKYSVDSATKNSGGLLSGVTKGQEEQALDKVAFSASPNTVIGPVHGTFGYYIVEVVKIKPATQQSLAQATKLITQILQSQTQQTAQAALDKQVKKDWLAQTKCRSLYAMADCSGYKAPRSSAPGAAGAAGAAGSAQQGAATLAALGELDAITRRLRRECPWDREQDERSIVPHTVEEAYELADAAHRGDDAKLLDELGDVLFQVHFLALLLSERAAGDLGAVATHCAQKLIRRHPHVFGDVRAETAGDVLRNWDQIKTTEAGREPGLFGEVPENLPGPLYARKVQRRAASSGFDFADGAAARAALADELDELDAATSAEARFHEVGDVLFAAVNLARKLRVDPELALRASADRFRGRVQGAAKEAASSGANWNDLTPGEQLRWYRHRPEEDRPTR